MVKVGEKIKDLKATDQNGEEINLSDLKGKKLIIYFYPKDMTSGCTKEAQGFRDLADDFQKLGVRVLGVSKDPVKSHKKFEEKEKLNFTLLSDEDLVLNKYFGVWVEKNMYGKKYMGTRRDTFIIDEDGKLIKHFEKVKAASHPEEVLKFLKEL